MSTIIGSYSTGKPAARRCHSARNSLVLIPRASGERLRSEDEIYVRRALARFEIVG